MKNMNESYMKKDLITFSFFFIYNDNAN